MTRKGSFGIDLIGETPGRPAGFLRDDGQWSACPEGTRALFATREDAEAHLTRLDGGVVVGPFAH